MKILNNKWVLVTGASSGLGYEMAYQLAVVHSANLIIVARRADNLVELKSKIEKEASIKVDIVPADLIIEEERTKVVNHCLQKENFYGIILNAGMTYFGEHLEMESATFQKIIDLNIISTVDMTNQFVQHFEQTNKSGRLMVVSSLAAFYPIPYQAVYSGSKAFISNFINALSHELKNSNLSLTVFSPGGIKTEMTNNDKFKKLEKWLMPVDVVAKEAIYAFKHGKYNYIPGFSNKLSQVFSKFIPRKLLSSILARQYRQSLDSAKKKS